MVVKPSESVPELLPAIFSPLGPVPSPKTAKIWSKLPINRPPAAAMFMMSELSYWLVSMLESTLPHKCEKNGSVSFYLVGPSQYTVPSQVRSVVSDLDFWFNPAMLSQARP